MRNRKSLEASSTKSKDSLFRFHIYTHSKLWYFAFVPNEMIQHVWIKGFSMKQFEIQKSVSQLFGALKSHFECVPFRYRSFRTTKKTHSDYFIVTSSLLPLYRSIHDETLFPSSYTTLLLLLPPPPPPETTGVDLKTMTRRHVVHHLPNEKKSKTLVGLRVYYARELTPLTKAQLITVPAREGEPNWVPRPLSLPRSFLSRSNPFLDSLTYIYVFR